MNLLKNLESQQRVSAETRLFGGERGIDSKRDCARVLTPCGGACGGPKCSRILSNRVLIDPHYQPDIKKTPLCGAFLMPGGERGIRTLDTLLTYTHFPGVLLKPLGHLS